MDKIVISLGGSTIVPDEIDTNFLKEFKKTVESHNANFVIITGGGSIARKYQTALKKIVTGDNETQDWMGIYATHLNAFLLKCIFEDSTDMKQEIITDPTKKLNLKNKITIAAGWKPGWSTDYDAVLLAKNIGAHTVINMSNIDYVYDSDPKTNPDAKPLEKISWNEFRSMLPEKWSPGLNMPFDPIAAKEAEKNSLKVIIIGKSAENLKNAIEGKKFKGTTISK